MHRIGVARVPFSFFFSSFLFCFILLLIEDIRHVSEDVSRDQAKMNTSRNCVKLWRTRQCGKPTCLAPSAVVISKKVVYWNAVISATEIHGYSTLRHVRADIWDFLFQWLAAVCALYTYEPAPEFHSWVSGCELFSGVQAVALAWSCFHVGWMLCTSFEKKKSTVELCQPVGSLLNSANL